MKKKHVFTIAAIIVTAAVLSACGAKTKMELEGSAAVEAAAPSKGNLISVDPKNLPKEIKESDLIREGSEYFINQYDLMDIAKKAKKDIVIESADGYKITASADGNELTKVPLGKDTKEKETMTGKDDGKNAGTNAGGTANNGGSANTGGNTAGGGSSDTAGTAGSSSSNGGSGGSSGGNAGEGTTPVQPPSQEPTQPAHTHSYTIYQGGTPATCTSTGTEIYACTCGATTTNTIPMTAHSFVPVYRTEDQGWDEDIVEYHTVCNACGAYLDGMSYDEIEAHSLSCGAGYSSKNIVVGQQWHSNPVEVFDHYECSVCGTRQ